MKKHKIVVELSTDDDNIARLYHSINDSGRLSELVEKLMYLQMEGYYEDKKVIRTRSEDTGEVANKLDALTIAIEQLQTRVSNGTIVTHSNDTSIGVEQVASTTVEHKEIEIIKKSPPKRKGKRDLSKLKKLKGGV